MIGVGTLDRCPWGELRNPVWRAAVDLWRYLRIGAVPDLLTGYAAQVARCVLALDDAVKERDAQAQKEALDNARRGG